MFDLAGKVGFASWLSGANGQIAAAVAFAMRAMRRVWSTSCIVGWQTTALLRSLCSTLAVATASFAAFWLYYSICVPSAVHSFPVSFRYPHVQGAWSPAISSMGPNDTLFLQRGDSNVQTWRPSAGDASMFHVGPDRGAAVANVSLMGLPNRGMCTDLSLVLALLPPTEGAASAWPVVECAFELLSAEGKEVASGSEHTVLSHSHWVVRLWSALLWGPFIASGLVAERHDRAVVLLWRGEGLPSDLWADVALARVSLRPPLPVQRAELQFHMRAAGVGWVVQRHPTLCCLGCVLLAGSITSYLTVGRVLRRVEEERSTALAEEDSRGSSGPAFPAVRAAAAAVGNAADTDQVLTRRRPRGEPVAAGGPDGSTTAKGCLGRAHASTVAASAIAGCAVASAGGAATGLGTGGAVGAAAGLLGAPLTMGLSIPLGAAVGATIGAAVGAAVGGTVGLLGGGATGHVCFQHRNEISVSVNDARALVGSYAGSLADGVAASVNSVSSLFVVGGGVKGSH